MLDLFGKPTLVKNEISLPYVGSKRLYASQIIGYIKSQHPEIDFLFDVFCGGGAISYYAMNFYSKIVMNDINADMIKWHSDIVYNNGEETIKTFNSWENSFVSLDEFNQIVNSNDNSLYSTIVKNIWSFSNNMSNYIYGKDKVNDKYNNTQLYISSNGKKGSKPDHIRRMDRVLRLVDAIKFIDYKPLITTGTYSDVFENAGETLSNESKIIYCDPPYENTDQRHYNDYGNFDSKKFYNWCKKLADNGIIVYVSSYDIDDPYFDCELSMKKTNTFNNFNDKRSRKEYEKLYRVRSKGKECK
jgi:site-specific DNA-adenine methylase